MLALSFDMALASATANRAEEEPALKRSLWMTIARHIVQQHPSQDQVTLTSTHPVVHCNTYTYTVVGARWDSYNASYITHCVHCICRLVLRQCSTCAVTGHLALLFAFGHYCISVVRSACPY